MTSPRRPPVVGLLILRATLLAYPELAPALVDALAQRGFEAELTLLPAEADADAALARAPARRLAGIVAAARPSPEAIAGAERAGTPVMLFNCYNRQAPHCGVSCDHAESGRAIATALARAGHRRFGLIAPPEDSLVGQERMAGVRAALTSHGVRHVSVSPGDFGYLSGAAALDAVLASMKPKPSAVIAANDAMALGALDRARTLGVRVPRDLSIAGFDGALTALWPSHELTTMQQPLARMVEAAADLMAAIVAHPDRPTEMRLFSASLLPGHTARLEARGQTVVKAARRKPPPAGKPARSSRKARLE